MTNHEEHRRWSPSKFATVWRRQFRRGAARNLAFQLEVSETTAHRWTVKLEVPPRHWWQRIAEHLGVTVEDITARGK